MFTPENIDVKRSLATGFLKYKKDIDYYVQTGISIVAFTFLAVWLYGTSTRIGNSPNDKFFSDFLIPAGYLLCGYAVVAMLLRDKLIGIETGIRPEKSYDILVDYFEKGGYEFSAKSGNYLIVNEPPDIGPAHNTNTVTVLTDEKKIYFHIKKDKKSWSPPLFSLFLLRNDLKKLFNKT